jgi:hypothetical protein
VKHGHVGLAAPPEIVPEDGRASDGRNGDAETRKGRPASSGDVREVDHEGRHAVAGQVGLAVDGFEAVGLKLELVKVSAKFADRVWGRRGEGRDVGEIQKEFFICFVIK